MQDPKTKFQDSFSGTKKNGYGFSNAFFKIVFAYSRYSKALDVVNEIKAYAAPLQYYIVLLIDWQR